MTRIAILLLLLATFPSQAQKIMLDRIDPPNWWTGMETNTVQLLIYGSGLKDATVTNVVGEPQVTGVYDPGNDQYLFVDLYIPQGTAPGNYKLTVDNGNHKQAFRYPVLERESRAGRHQGFGPEDVIYLLMPDRFANGDPTNDIMEGWPGKTDRKDPGAWHGGDLQGIIDHLDYLADLGITTLWLNPFLENRMKGAYHGYATTDLYRVDPRFGDNELFKQLVEEAHSRGLKVVFDHILNHIGSGHHWIQEGAPTETWFNGSQEEHYSEGHFQPAIHDPYAAPGALQLTQTAWFVDEMPDLNQRDPRVLKYMTDQTLWWIEFAGLDGIREDTYPYVFPETGKAWTEALLENYPDINVVGESWGTTLFTALYQRGNKLPSEFETALPAVMDFGLMTELRRFTEGEGRLWNIYERLGYDFVFGDPMQLVTFMENHDTHRVLLSAKDARRVKLALMLQLTTRGIPQILYGVEIGATGGYSHVELRIDFPGGWAEDERSAFTADGRTAAENEWFDFVRTLLHIRKQNPALQTGTMVHAQPDWRGPYCYKRSHEEGDVLVVLYEHEEAKDWDMHSIQSLLGEAKSLTDLHSGEKIPLEEGASMNLAPVSGRIFSIGY